MDQASTLPRSRSPRPPIPLATGRPGAAIAPAPEIDAAPTTLEDSRSDAASDPGEDPESPGGRLASGPLIREVEANGDPLAEPIAALLGAALAVVALLVPILTVVTTPVDSSSELRSSPAATPALSRSRPIEARPAAALAP
jgi:hypothetical protein